MWGKIENLGIPGNGKSIGNAVLTFNASAAVAFSNVPFNAKSALITLEAHASTVDIEKAARFLEYTASQSPTAAIGTPLANGSTYEIIGYDNIIAFKIIAIEALEHKLQIMYYS